MSECRKNIDYKSESYCIYERFEEEMIALGTSGKCDNTESNAADKLSCSIQNILDNLDQFCSHSGKIHHEKIIEKFTAQEIYNKFEAEKEDTAVSNACFNDIKILEEKYK
ncbi:PIR Superfamily Protein [Plasmodium ovale curtisi]|uniref:PIR Superfamily Protein n=1 Tax=Plasmodium ovale curtisi TaxID=864141 RepID=A0A1A8XBG4_PLAOA|nr:PIR Superfamily Protein [Plasmodium ovale curtisi]SBT02536.1 PIR Superfamily Protein [Plasmodium ovale curtisi]